MMHQKNWCWCCDAYNINTDVVIYINTGVVMHMIMMHIYMIYIYIYI